MKRGVDLIDISTVNGIILKQILINGRKIINLKTDLLAWVILSKISSLSRCIDRIEIKKTENVDVLLNDLDLQDIISGNFQRKY